MSTAAVPGRPYDPDRHLRPPLVTLPEYWRATHRRDVPTSECRIMVGFVLCLFFGVLGLHRFYAGRYASGFAMLLITVATGGAGLVVTGFWVLLDLGLLGTGSFRDGSSLPLRRWT